MGIAILALLALAQPEAPMAQPDDIAVDDQAHRSWLPDRDFNIATPVQGNCTEPSAALTARTFLALLNSQDRDSIMRSSLPQGRATMISVPSEEIRSGTWFDFIGRLPSQALQPVQYLGQSNVRANGHIAVVSIDYRVNMNDGYQVRGDYHLNLVCSQGEWRVLNLTYSAESVWPQER